MKITPQIKNAFDQKADAGIYLQAITETPTETKFTAFVVRTGKVVTVGCAGKLTARQAEEQAGAVAAYLSSMASKECIYGNG